MVRTGKGSRERSAQELIRILGLKPHPEGGFYRETYWAAGKIPAGVLPSAFHGDRSFCTCIYFLLPSGSCSRFHRIASDEIWHFYLGGPLELIQLGGEEEARRILLGPNLEQGEQLQCVVPAGCWFAARPLSSWSLVGCTVAPGFDFAEFELASREELLKVYPQARPLIEALTVP